MWVIKRQENHQLQTIAYNVGYYTPDGEWFNLSTHYLSDSSDSMARHCAKSEVNYLNGGNKE